MKFLIVIIFSSILSIPAYAQYNAGGAYSAGGGGGGGGAGGVATVCTPTTLNDLSCSAASATDNLVVTVEDGCPLDPCNLQCPGLGIRAFCLYDSATSAWHSIGGAHIPPDVEIWCDDFDWAQDDNDGTNLTAPLPWEGLRDPNAPDTRQSEKIKGMMGVLKLEESGSVTEPGHMRFEASGSDWWVRPEEASVVWGMVAGRTNTSYDDEAFMIGLADRYWLQDSATPGHASCDACVGLGRLGGDTADEFKLYFEENNGVEHIVSSAVVGLDQSGFQGDFIQFNLSLNPNCTNSGCTTPDRYGYRFRYREIGTAWGNADFIGAWSTEITGNEDPSEDPNAPLSNMNAMTPYIGAGDGTAGFLVDEICVAKKKGNQG